MPALTRARVLSINAPQHIAQEYLDEINEIVDFVVIEQVPHLELIPVIAKAVEEHGPFIACITFLNWAAPTPWPMNEALMGPLVDTGCRFFTCGGAGYEKMDIKYFTCKGVIYANNPNAMAVRTADTCAMMLLQAMRATSHHEARLRQGIWQDRSMVAKDARSSTLGIVGLGKIGKLVSEHMQHFGMKVRYTQRARLPPSEENGAAFVSFDDLLATSDVISLHCPLTEDTRHLIGAPEFAKMKQGVIIVNTSRGAVIDENALVQALESGKVLRCALDVYEEEPKVHPGLLATTKAIMSPHCAVMNETVFQSEQTETMANLEAFIRTGTPNTPVN